MGIFYFIITEIPHTVSTVSIFLFFFFPSYHHHPCFMGEIRRSKRSNRSQSECSKQLWGGDTMPHSAPHPCRLFGMSSLSWASSQLLDPRRPGPSGDRNEHVFSWLVPWPLPLLLEVSQGRSRYSTEGTLGSVWILWTPFGIIRNLLAQK